MKAFLEIKEHEAILSKEGAKKVSRLAIGRFIYAALDYLIASGLGIMVVWMNVRGFSTIDIYMATFAYDWVAALFFYFLSDLSGYDITLAISFRRAADVMFRNGIIGMIFGGLLLLGVSVKAIIWEGPEVICFLFRKELKTRTRFHLVMVVLTAFQAVFGIWLYTTGYEMFKSLLPAKVEFWHLALMAIAIFVTFSLMVFAIKKLVKLTVLLVGFFKNAPRKEKIILVINMIVLVVVIVIMFIKMR